MRQPDRLWIGILALVCGGFAAGGVLVDNDFDRDSVDTGPSLIVWEDAKGRVTLSSDYAHSGHRSVEISDVSRDGNFTELQGQFAQQKEGALTIRFAFMTAEPDEEFNIAFAGPGHFYLREDGMGFWLKGVDGKLRQMNSLEWSEVTSLRAFVWYVVEVDYDIEDGRYDLTIVQEGDDEPLVKLRELENAIGSPGATLSKYSFIGAEPWNDDSDVTFYVDDVYVANDRGDDAAPPVAPGRRMLFVDMYDRYRARMYEKPGCPPVLDHEDFGLGDLEMQALAAVRGRSLYEAVARVEQPSPEIEAIRLWQRGCAAPRGCGEPCALELFRRAAEHSPSAKIYPMSRLLALVAEKQWAEADELLLMIRGDWLTDPRFPALSATIGIARGNLNLAEEWLRATADGLPVEYEDPLIRRLWTGLVDAQLVHDLRRTYPGSWNDFVATSLVLEQRYYVLLWRQEYAAARRYAERMVDRLRAMRLPTMTWIVREADAAFYQEDYGDARELYEAVLPASPGQPAILLRLSDVHFMLGNTDLERLYREKIYGTLERRADDGIDDAPRFCPPVAVDDDGDELRQQR